MSTQTEAWPEFDPGEFYGPQNQPPLLEQEAFINDALLEAEHIEDPARYLKGPFNQHFSKICQDIDGFIREVNPKLTPEFIMPFGYRSREVQQMEGELKPEERIALGDLQRERDARIRRLASDVIAPVVMDQVIPKGVLDEPAYRWQGQHWRDYSSGRACANACFRMTLNGIAGFDVQEHIVARGMIRHRGNAVVPDSEYRKIFATDVFKETTNKRVISFELAGADLKAIGSIAMRIKQRNEDAKVFSTLILGSDRASKDTWHHNVLLAADARGVICHDPAAADKLPARILRREDFIKRWSIAHNRAQIFIST